MKQPPKTETQPTKLQHDMPEQAPQLDYSETRKIPANFCSLRHTNEEFIIDVGMSLIIPDDAPKIDISLIITPFMAKRLWTSLGAIVASYESIFGEIEIEAENRAVAAPPTPFETAMALKNILLPEPPPEQFSRSFCAPTPIDICALADQLATDVVSEPNNSPCLPAEFPDN